VRLKSILITLLLLVMLLPACTTAVPRQTEIAAEQPTRAIGALKTAEPTQTVADAPQAEASTPKPVKGEQPSDGRVIVYHTSGGIAGITEEWIIYADGTVLGPGGSKQQLNPQRVQEVVQMAGEMPDQEPDPLLDPCCDRITYTITFYFEDETKILTTTDGAEQTAELTAVLDELGRLLTGLRR
jgi:hypothetical protein